LRYIGAMEAVWRIFHFPLQDRHPAVQRLDVHLEHQQRIIFQDGQADAVVAKGEPRTTLTEFFKSNAVDNTAKRYFYHEFPEHYTWNQSSKNGVIVSAVKAALLAGCTQFIRTRETYTTCA